LTAAVLGILFFTSFAIFIFSDPPSAIREDEEFSVSVTLKIANSAGKDYFLRAAFSHPDTSTSYFGYTKDQDGNWYNGTPPPIDYKKFFKITMNSDDSWSGNLTVKPDSKSSSYKGTGNYQFKIGRYTSAGSGPTWSDNKATIYITSSANYDLNQETVATASSSPSATTADSPSFTPTASISTPTPSSSLSPSPFSSQTPFALPTPQLSLSPEPSSEDLVHFTSPLSSPVSFTNVLAASNSSANAYVTPLPFSSTKTATSMSEAAKTSSNKLLLAACAISAGLVLLGWAGFGFLKQLRSDRINSNEEG
jgi:hypothetical protein